MFENRLASAAASSFPRQLIHLRSGHNGIYMARASDEEGTQSDGQLGVEGGVSWRYARAYYNRCMAARRR
jgi:hypothetical protein